MTQAVKELQIAFQSLEAALVSLKLVLNSQKTKFMCFLKAQSQVLDNLSIFTSDGKIIERVPSYYNPNSGNVGTFFKFE